ncbi:MULTISPECIES: hypothetical protein [Rhodopseudomonas]|uniref:Uncharacterized protein n=1 Tax=Rhodopseudomonas palustris TaxID=1076 RepID=A0A0D7F3M3_RHOPL|nr:MULTISPECIES: hypothetical protein [Rhodopseudomonas]KIZ47390.1 hypothetical protein OO17_04590 [Rhodopseudomonas palustris]MDF3809266.1 hypothetical protein [Rhodopseudomonas sp. BAL398]WOK19049.1 hypothetical protein RBJ75_05895 [Rhodopseudomonas sp. BAL398]
MSGPAVNPAHFGPRQAQPLDGLSLDAKSILEGLFDAPNAKDMPAFARAAIEQNERIRNLAARLLGEGDGEELMEALCDVTLRRATFITQMGMPSDQVLAMGQFREGMAATVYLLLAWIAEGRSEQQPNREGTIDVSRAKRRRQSKPQPAKPPAKRVARKR